MPAIDTEALASIIRSIECEIRERRLISFFVSIRNAEARQ